MIKKCIPEKNFARGSPHLKVYLRRKWQICRACQALSLWQICRACQALTVLRPAWSTLSLLFEYEVTVISSGTVGRAVGNRRENRWEPSGAVGNRPENRREPSGAVGNRRERRREPSGAVRNRRGLYHDTSRAKAISSLAVCTLAISITTHPAQSSLITLSRKVTGRCAAASSRGTDPTACIAYNT